MCVKENSIKHLNSDGIGVTFLHMILGFFSRHIQGVYVRLTGQVFINLIILFVFHWSYWDYGSFLGFYLITLNSKINHNINTNWNIHIWTWQVRNPLCTPKSEKSWKLIFCLKLHQKTGANDSNWWILSKIKHYDLLRLLEAVFDFISNYWPKMNFCCFNHCMYRKYLIDGAKCRSY